MSIAEEARREALASHAAGDSEACTATCERAVVRVSLDNLMSFPVVRAAVAAGRLRLHGWYFDVERGELHGYDRVSSHFDVVAGGATPPAQQASKK